MVTQQLSLNSESSIKAMIDHFTEVIFEEEVNPSTLDIDDWKILTQERYTARVINSQTASHLSTVAWCFKQYNRNLNSGQKIKPQVSRVCLTQERRLQSNSGNTPWIVLCGPQHKCIQQKAKQEAPTAAWKRANSSFSKSHDTARLKVAWARTRRTNFKMAALHEKHSVQTLLRLSCLLITTAAFHCVLVTSQNKNRNLSFYHIPKDTSLREDYRRLISNKTLKVESSHTWICSAHFDGGKNIAGNYRLSFHGVNPVKKRKLPPRSRLGLNNVMSETHLAAGAKFKFEAVEVGV